MKPSFMSKMLAMSAIIGMTGRLIREEKQPIKCGLKDCQLMTTHNGGYCCAEHCKLDRKRNRSNAKLRDAGESGVKQH